jgi:UDP-glucose 4-epimerase
MRVLVTGLGTMWGSRVAQLLEQESGIDVIVGVDTHEPRLPLEKTEFVRADSSYAILHRIVAATRVDTIVHTHLITDSAELGGRALHEVNVIGTANLLAAAGAPDSPVQKLVMKSSTLVYGSSPEDPYWFLEDSPRTRSPQSRVERSLVEAENIVRDFADDNPEIAVTQLRFADTLGETLESPFQHLLHQSVVPEVLGYDPRLQFVHDDDAGAALVFATNNWLPGVYNVAGEGTLPWSEVAAICGRRRVPLPPLLTSWATEPLRVLGIANLRPEMLSLLRYGRAVDRRRFERTGFDYRFTTAETVEEFARTLRLRGAVGAAVAPYRYEQDVEAFFRHSPAVVRDRH